VAVDDAKRLQAQAAEDPSMLTDPLVQAETRWVSLFDPELSAVQTVYESAESGAHLSPYVLRSATAAATELVRIHEGVQVRILGADAEAIA
jgi:hypothetical protein